MFHEVKLNFKSASSPIGNGQISNLSNLANASCMVIKNYPWDFEPKQQH